MQLGGDVCLLQHVSDVYNRFMTNEHDKKTLTKEIGKIGDQHRGCARKKVRVYMSQTYPGS